MLVLSGLAIVAVDIQLLGHLPDWIPSGWVYSGGDTGARTLLGAIASSTIGVAGTLFSITIAALTLASSQMGPRLLRNFMRDRGNQVTLGVLLGTFGYALIVLRSVRGGEDSAFVPSLGVTIGLLLAGACVALLIYFIHHVANRINVDTVIDLVHDDVVHDMERLTLEDPCPVFDDDIDWDAATAVCLPHSGYLQQLDTSALVSWACEQRLRHPDAETPGRVRLPVRADRSSLQACRRRRGCGLGSYRPQPAGRVTGRFHLPDRPAGRGRGAGSVAWHQRSREPPSACSIGSARPWPGWLRATFTTASMRRTAWSVCAFHPWIMRP